MKTTMMKRWLSGLAAGVLLSTFAFAQGDTPPPGDSRARLAAAKAVVTGLKGVRGPERLAGMREAATAYEAVARDFADDRMTCVRAHWEAGECWRRAAEFDQAAAAYGRVLDGDPGRYEQRAAFERASVLRRMKKYDEALELYRRAGALAVEGVRAHDARVWVARVQELQGEPEAAIAAYRAAVEAAVGPRRIVDASDACAKALIRRGDLDGAAAVIGGAEAAARATIEAGGQTGERLKRAVGEMGSRRQLQRARDKANGTVKDAVDLESGKR